MSHMTTLADLLPAAAERNPDGIAIRDRGVSTTWEQALQQANRLTNALGEVGVRQGDRVGIHYRKCADAFLAMHATVRCGAIAVPLDPTASGEYVASVARNAGCRVVMTHEPCRQSTERLIAERAIDAVIGIETMDALDHSRCLGPSDLESVDDTNPLHRPIPGDLAYIITTSGSTGRPKGICHTHRSALAYVEFKRAAYDYGPHDRIGDLAPNHFDISTQALWVTPAVGATNVVLPEEHQLFPASLAELMETEAITVWYGVPYVLTQLLSRGNLSERDLSALRWVLFGGEVVSAEMLTQLMEQLPHARFSNVYGPAEVNACAVHHLAGPPQPGSSIPIGQPVGETEIRLVAKIGDSDGSPKLVDPGEQGEIWVRAATMMAGYWGQPERHADSIVEWDGAQWYRTGDLGFENKAGDLVFSGRIDHQVKVRGYRIELESIESVLEEADGVANAIAAVARNADGSDVVIAGLITEPDVELDSTTVSRLTEHARRRLPSYAVPTRCYPVGSPPVTGSGKLDRRRIRIELWDVHTGGGMSDV